MKSPSPKGKQKRAGKLPAATVQFQSRPQGDDSCWRASNYLGGLHSDRFAKSSDGVLAVLPTDTAKQAKALVAFANLNEREKVERVAKALWRLSWGRAFRDSIKTLWAMKTDREKEHYRMDARAILQATGHIAGRDK